MPRDGYQRHYVYSWPATTSIRGLNWPVIEEEEEEEKEDEEKDKERDEEKAEETADVVENATRWRRLERRSKSLERTRVSRGVAGGAAMPSTWSRLERRSRAAGEVIRSSAWIPVPVA